MKNHLPYNVLLIATVAAVGLTMVFNLYVRQSSFAVHVGYVIPVPAAVESPTPAQIETPPQILPPPVAPLSPAPPQPAPPPAAPQSPQFPEPVQPTQPPLPPPAQIEAYILQLPEHETTQPVFYDPPAAVVQFPIELNSATSEQLQLVRGIGAVTAQRILDHRWQIGGFTHLSQLLEVSGIGPATFERMSPYFYVAGQAEWEQRRWEQEWAEYLRAWEEYHQQVAAQQQVAEG